MRKQKKIKYLSRREGGRLYELEKDCLLGRMSGPLAAEMVLGLN